MAFLRFRESRLMVSDPGRDTSPETLLLVVACNLLSQLVF